MLYEVLYCKKIEGITPYCKIVTIKPIGWKWGSGELNENSFGIINLELTDEVVSDIQTKNMYCILDDGSDITYTPPQYQTDGEIL